MERSKRTKMLEDGNLRLADFKHFLRRKYGSLVRACRCLLSPDDSMVLHKPQFLKACAKIGWQEDAKLIWQVLDNDDSGEATLDELDPQSAEVFASFRTFALKRFGSMSAAFRALDTDGTKTVSLDEFVKAMEAFGFDRPSKSKLIFQGLDKDGMDRLTEENVLFLEKWKPLPFLLSHPNLQAAKEFKALLLKRFGNFLNAWRQILDKDNSNACNWNEFLAACSKLHFAQDVPGAWRALDKDLSGCISLNELDPVSNTALLSFKCWAEQEFGGVRSAFRVFDADGSKEITSAEFKQCCHIFGFRGDVRTIFKALDVEGGGTLTPLEVFFLDDWEVDAEEREEPRAIHFPEATRRAGTASQESRPGTAWQGLAAAGAGDAAEGPRGGVAAQLVPGAAAAARRPEALKPGLAVWQNSRNPWRWPRRGPLPPMPATLNALLEGKPPPVDPPPAKRTAAKAALAKAARRPLPVVPEPFLHAPPTQSA